MSDELTLKAESEPAPHQHTMQDEWSVDRKQFYIAPVRYLITAITNVPTIAHASTYLVAPSVLPNYLPTY
jgi:hypothetical protein